MELGSRLRVPPGLERDLTMDATRRKAVPSWGFGMCMLLRRMFPWVGIFENSRNGAKAQSDEILQRNS